jgi:hypothetical protein
MMTTTNAFRYRINQEIKFLYHKKQNLNHQMYHIHLKCMHHCKGLWQHIQNSIDSQINDFMDKTYLKLNKTYLKHTQKTEHNHMLPQHCKTYNDVFLLINSTKV